MISRWGTARESLRKAASGPAVTYGLIAVCCAIFVISPVSGLNPVFGLGDRLLAAQAAYFERWGVIPAELTAGSPGALLTPLTALFVHGSWLHLLGNMLFLFVFGAMAEERMGQLEFVLFYIGAGYVALLVFAVVNADSQQTLVGASGAISAVLGAFLFFLPLRFPAWAVLIFWFVLQWLAARGAGSGPGVAYLAHLVGFGAGFVYAWGRYGRGTRVNASAATEGESQP